MPAGYAKQEPCSLCQRRERTCSVLTSSPRCEECVHDNAARSFTMPTLGEWNRLNRAEDKLKQQLGDIFIWIETEVDKLKLQLAQISASRLHGQRILQLNLDEGPKTDDEELQARFKLLDENINAHEVMAIKISRLIGLRKQLEFLEKKGSEMVRRGMKVLDEEDAMDWEERGDPEDDDAEEELDESDDAALVGEADLMRDPDCLEKDVEKVENGVAISDRPPIKEIPTALLHGSESLRLERESLLQERLACLINITKLNEDSANLRSRFSRMINLGLHSFEELAALEEAEMQNAGM